MSYIATPMHTAAAATGNGETIDVSEVPEFSLHFVNTGSPVGTVSFEGTVDGTNYVAVPMETATGTLVTSTTAAGYFRSVRGHALLKFRAPISAFTSGLFTVVTGRTSKR